MRILVAGIGNVFHRDDGFGVEVARRLAGQALPEGVRLVDFGIRGRDMAFELADGYDAAILVDAVSRGEAPGTLYVLDVGAADTLSGNMTTFDGHSPDPSAALAMLRDLGGGPGRILLVGCEPAEMEPRADGAMGLSAPVAAALDGAVETVLALVGRLRSERAAPREVSAHA